MKRILQSIDLRGHHFVYHGKKFHEEVYYNDGFSAVVVYNDQVYYVHHYTNSTIVKSNEIGLAPLKKYLKGTPWH